MEDLVHRRIVSEGASGVVEECRAEKSKSYLLEHDGAVEGVGSGVYILHRLFFIYAVAEIFIFSAIHLVGSVKCRAVESSAGGIEEGACPFSARLNTRLGEFF